MFYGDFMNTVNRWIAQAQYDLDTPLAMLESKRHLYVIFCCQQAIEKAIKAVILQKTQKFPPRLHNLLRLAEIAEIEIEEDTRTFPGELSAYYIQTRYPDEYEQIGKEIRDESARKVFQKTKETVEWLTSIMK